jgi:hypothetical protein
MKKLVLIFVVALFSCNTQAQTFTQTQERVSAETAKLEKRLSEIKDRIFYLEVTVPNKMKKSKTLSELRELEKEDYFSKDETVRLRSEMDQIKKSLAEVTKTGLEGVEYRTEADMKSNLPERMNQREYGQRVRANNLKSETSGQMYEGVMVNYKMGQGEIANIFIYRNYVSGLPPVLKATLLPGQREKDLLPAGDYIAIVSCGPVTEQYTFSVGPHAGNKKFEGVKTGWAVWKNQNDS